MENKFKRLYRTDIYDGIRVHLIKERLLTPEGKEVDWELVIHPGAAAIIPVDDEGKIIMVRQYRNASDSYTLEIPAGTLDSPDEDPLECAHRELEEETGYKTKDMSYLYNFYSSIGITDEVIHIYVAKNLIESVQNLDDDEFVTIERYTLGELVDMIFAGDIVDNKTISAVLTFKESLSRSKA